MLQDGQLVRIYWNLHRDVFSVQTKQEKGWRVTAHVSLFLLTFPKFKVSEAGRQRVLREQRKNVHAYIQGIWKSKRTNLCPWRDAVQISYNPYKHGHFYPVLNPTEPVRLAKAVWGCAEPSAHLMALPLTSNIKPY